jgi:hypothetical protein
MYRICLIDVTLIMAILFNIFYDWYMKEPKQVNYLKSLVVMKN